MVDHHTDELGNMFLSPTQWEEFSTYLFVDRKLSTTKTSINPLKSRFIILSRYFSTVPFNRTNFNTFIKQMIVKGNKNTYINGFIKLAKHVDKWLKLNELQDYTYFREEDNDYDVLTSEEIVQLAECQVVYQRDIEYQSHRNKTLIYFVAMTGCRINEALSLTWKDVIDSPIPVAIFRETKNGDTRYVPLRGILPGLLQSLPRRSDLVFNSIDDKRLSLDLKNRADIIGLKKRVWWHLLRHSFITNLIQQGVDDLIIAKIVGHKNPASTQRYNHVNLMSLAVMMDLHPLFQENQTMESVTDYLIEHIQKFLNKKRFSLSTDQNMNQLTIKIESHPLHLRE